MISKTGLKFIDLKSEQKRRKKKSNLYI